jgi:geranylgeranyl diphosphate/geranylgeranyl-bacteriochlorophyllide a reductase
VTGKKSTYDIVIIGAGPAGSTLARLVGSRYRTLLVDRRHFDCPEGPFPTKCCGGLLAPDAQKVIAEMGLCAGRDILVGPQLFAVRAIDMERSLERYYQRFYINIDREKFDRWLFGLVPSCVENRMGTIFKGFTRDKNHIDVRLYGNDTADTVRTRMLVGADGATSYVRRLAFGLRRPGSEYLSIQEWFETAHPTPHYAALFDRAVTDFYSWIIPKEQSIILGTALRERGRAAAERFSSLKKKVANFGYRLGETVRREGTLIIRPGVSDIITGDNSIVLIGEAAGFISPSSAEGISYAFRSACALAESLKTDFDGVNFRYRKIIRSLRMNVLLKTIKAPMMYNPFLRRIVMGTGFQSISPDGNKRY